MSPTTKKNLTWIGVLLGVYLIYVGYNVFSMRAELSEYFQVKKILRESEDIYRNDWIGGKTPQETLNMFISALEANDVALATSYFMPDDAGSREKWRKVLQGAYDRGSFSSAIDDFKKATPAKERIIGNRFYGFATRNENGDVILDISLQFNGNVWKIDNL